MLGAVTALRRGEHMRMTALIGRLSPSPRAVLEAVATAACLAFLALVVWPAWQYAADERAITTPALEISNLWRAAALPVGIVLMATFALLRMLRFTTRSDAVKAIVVVVVIAGAVLVAAAGLRASRPSQPAGLLRRRRRRLRSCRHPDRVRVRPRHLRLSRVDDEHAAHGGRRSHGRRHVAPDPARGAAVRVPRPADRDDRHGAGDGRLPRQPARPCQGRPLVRAGRRDVPRLGHLGRQGGRHGGDRAGAVPGDEGARRRTKATWSRCSPPPARRPRPSRRASCSSPSAR